MSKRSHFLNIFLEELYFGEITAVLTSCWVIVLAPLIILPSEIF